MRSRSGSTHASGDCTFLPFTVTRPAPIQPRASVRDPRPALEITRSRVRRRASFEPPSGWFFAPSRGLNTPLGARGLWLCRTARTPYDRTAMIECVPNFSEGRDVGVVRDIAAAIASTEGVTLLGWEADADHHRSVVTFAGPADAVREGAIRGVGAAVERIDLTKHHGVHPRVGAADVVPFVPLEGSTIEECVEVAHRAGEEIWERFRV